MKLATLTALLTAAAFAQEPSAAQRNNRCYELRGQHTPELVAAMRQAIDDPVVRACAARNLREAQAVDALVDALRTGAADTKIAAARELGELHDPRAIAPLGEAAVSPNPLVASSAIAALGGWDDAAALAYLLKAAALPTIAGVTALEQAARSKDPAILPVARHIVEHGDAASQVVALAILGDLGDASDLPRLRKLAETAEPVYSRGRGFGFMPPIDLARVARNTMAKISAR